MDYCLSMLRLKPTEDQLKLSYSELLDQDLPNYNLKFTSLELDVIHHIKEEGNSYSNQEKYDKAIKSYSKGIAMYKIDRDAKSEPLKSQNSPQPLQLLSQLLSNRASCFIKLAEYQKALEDSQSITVLRPNWVKGYYRKGESLFGLRMFQEALESYLMAQTLVIKLTGPSRQYY